MLRKNCKNKLKKVNPDKNVELCIRDKENRIVAWQCGYTDEEIDDLIAKHKKDGWHRSAYEF